MESPSDKSADRVPANEAALSALEGASDRSPGLRRLIGRAVEFADVDQSKKELVLDVRALVYAAIVVDSEKVQGLSSAAWMVEGLGGEKALGPMLGILRSISSSKSRELYESGYSIVASRSVRSLVIPRALDLAKETVRRATFDQRHLLIALLELSPVKWPDIGQPVTPKLLRQAHDHIITTTLGSPERGENVWVWQELLRNPWPNDSLDNSVDSSPTDEPEGSDPDFNDHLAAQRDDPAVEDQLGRQHFAQVIAARIVEVREGQQALMDQGEAAKGRDKAFMVHLDGAWGSGKSSVLNFIESDLKDRDPKWLVVKFNAWRNHHIEPAWWAVMCQMVEQVQSQLSGPARWKFRAAWLWWKLRNDFAPIVLGAILITLGMLLLFSSPILSWLAQVTGGKAEPIGQALANFAKFLGGADSLKGIVGILTTIGGLAGLSRTIFFGSATTGKAMEELRSDPYTPVMELFDRLVRTAKRPILIVIDDIDRCNIDYVVKLLENIQTMLRETAITYVVAGDRKWITTSFEDSYAKFRAPLDEPGRPLGHLFLDKVFQLSVPIPEIGAGDASRFWESIINKGTSEAATPDDVEKARAAARESVAGQTSEEGIQQLVEDADTEAAKEAIAAEGALRIASSDFAQAIESRYAKYGPLLDRNPRGIKRLVNKLAINQAMMVLERRRIKPGPLARWTIIELRWPLLAELLRTEPEWLDDPDKAPDEMAELLRTDAHHVLGKDSPEDERLTTAELTRILGIAEKPTEKAKSG